MAVYWQFIAVSMGETIFNAAPGTPEFEEPCGWVGAVNGMYNLVTIFAALALIPWRKGSAPSGSASSPSSSAAWDCSKPPTPPTNTPSSSR